MDKYTLWGALNHPDFSQYGRHWVSSSWVWLAPGWPLSAQPSNLIPWIFGPVCQGDLPNPCLLAVVRTCLNGVLCSIPSSTHQQLTAPVFPPIHHPSSSVDTKQIPFSSPYVCFTSPYCTMIKKYVTIRVFWPILCFDMPIKNLTELNFSVKALNYRIKNMFSSLYCETAFASFFISIN